MPTEVTVAHLKARLSHYLRAAQQGEEVLIKNRQIPVARLLPVEKPPARRLLTIPPAGSLKELDRLAVRRPRKLKPGDVDRALAWVRRERLLDRES
jgi:prevent-host-death family protein